LCGTYPRLLAVPRAVTDEALSRAAAFRSGRRLPVLCWKDAFGVASICRCSQPLVGVANKRSADDEALLRAIAETNPIGETLHILDCRPKLNAEVNQVKGKGYEHACNYAATRLTFMNIENIHAMRSSLKAFLAVLKKQAAAGETSIPELEKSGWLEHLRMVLKAALHAARLLEHDRASVVVHCSDGWDRTSQVTALAQLALDPTFRTRRGFEQLIAKEWLSFGHQFAKRCGTIAPLERGAQSSEEQFSPVFLQYVDCVHQLCEQFPSAFEFNSLYLAELLHHLTSCLHGTLLGNCERQRADLPPTVPLWPALSEPRFVNQSYAPGAHTTLHIDPGAVRPWTAYYCRGAERIKMEQLPLLETRCSQLADETERLRRRLQQLASDGEAAEAAPAAPPVAPVSPRVAPRRAEPTLVPFEEDQFVAPSFDDDADAEP